jgi:L-aspartate oxidase
MSLIATAPTRLSKQHICRAPGQSRHRCYPDHRQRKLAAPACVPGLCPPLITEALRVAGALLHHASASALMAGVSSLGDAGPRDIVPRRVTAGQAAGGRVWLDATAVEGDWAQRFPTVLAACLAHGFDPRLAALPVRPAVHFHIGGLATDANGRTSVPGLFAVGEVACNGVHGANRLTSNSLLEGVLCGRRLGKLLAHANTPIVRNETIQLVERGDSLAPAQLAALREWLSHAAGPMREAASLRDAWRACASINGAGTRWARIGGRIAAAHADSRGPRRDDFFQCVCVRKKSR